MTQRFDDHDDAMFDAFLRGEDELSRRLKAMPQPVPSAELSARILAQAQAALTAPAASNDAAIPQPLRTKPFAPHFLRRIGAPMALAASVAVAVLVTLQWGAGLPTGQDAVVAQSDAPTVIAQADDVQSASGTVWRSVPPPAAAPSSVAPPSDPKAWLEKIEELARAGARQEALAEWARFRKEYPQHPVPQALQRQLQAWQAQQAKAKGKPDADR